MPDCIFCRIVKGQVPCSKVYENDRVLAFMDINPVAPGHVLVIPKAHSNDVAGMSEGDMAAVALALRKLAPAVVTAVGGEGYNILNNCGGVAGQAVEHVHFHVIPRKTGDGRGYRWVTLSYRDGEIEKLAAAIMHKL